MRSDRALYRVSIVVLCLLLFLSALGTRWMMGQDQGRSDDVFFESRDADDVRIVLPRRPERVVSLNLSIDEILLALADSDQIAALSWYADDPGLSSMTAEAGKVAGRVRNLEPESVLACHPDLVITTDAVPAELVETLRDAGVTVYVTKNPDTIEEVLERIDTVGKLIGHTDRAEALHARLQGELDHVASVLQTVPPSERLTVVAFSFQGAYGRRGGLFDDMCRRAGAVNGAALVDHEGGQPIPLEQVLSINPDAILLPTWSVDGKDTEAYKERLMNDPVLKDTKAVQNGMFIVLPDQYRYSASQNAVEAVVRLAEMLYPSAFNR